MVIFIVFFMKCFSLWFTCSLKISKFSLLKFKHLLWLLRKYCDVIVLSTFPFIIQDFSVKYLIILVINFVNNMAILLYYDSCNN